MPVPYVICHEVVKCVLAEGEGGNCYPTKCLEYMQKVDEFLSQGKGEIYEFDQATCKVTCQSCKQEAGKHKKSCRHNVQAEV